jgi:predicted esterase
LGQQLALPETACIAVRAPKPLPFDIPGFHWGDDINIDESTGSIDPDAGFKDSVKLICNRVIQDTLINKCGYRSRDIIIFGFGQGGMVALQAALEMQDDELGGIVSIGGPLPISAPLLTIDKKCKTPVLLCKGSTKSAVSSSSVTRLKDTFTHTEVKEWKKSGDGMPANREEMLPVMQFFARRLRSTRGVPEGSIELT